MSWSIRTHKLLAGCVERIAVFIVIGCTILIILYVLLFGLPSSKEEFTSNASSVFAWTQWVGKAAKQIPRWNKHFESHGVPILENYPVEGKEEK